MISSSSHSHFLQRAPSTIKWRLALLARSLLATLVAHVKIGLSLELPSDTGL